MCFQKTNITGAQGSGTHKLKRSSLTKEYEQSAKGEHSRFFKNEEFACSLKKAIAIPKMIPSQTTWENKQKTTWNVQTSMANHMQNKLEHTLFGVSTVSIGKDRFQDVYRHKARYRFWDCYRLFQGTCKFLVFEET